MWLKPGVVGVTDAAEDGMSDSGGVRVFDDRLQQHLTAWLGQWPSRSRGLSVVGCADRLRPGWDGGTYLAIGIATPDSGVLSVPPDEATNLAVFEGTNPDRVALDRLLGQLPTEFGRVSATTYRNVFRFCDRPAPLPDVGAWEAPAGADIPDWLRVFDGDVLIARNRGSGEFLAGVGIKRHDGVGRELAVGTDPPARGRGLARRLVAQAARRIIDEGGVPTYQHLPDNSVSARVADAAGFPDRGWWCFGLDPDRQPISALPGSHTLSGPLQPL